MNIFLLEQRKVSLSTLQSKAARRRDDAQKKKVPKRKIQPQTASKMNGLTTATVDRVKDSHNLIDCEQIEMDTIQVKIEGGKAPDKKAVSIQAHPTYGSILL